MSKADELVAAEAVDLEEPEAERQHHRHADEDQQPERIGQEEQIGGEAFALVSPKGAPAALFASAGVFAVLARSMSYRIGAPL